MKGNFSNEDDISKVDSAKANFGKTIKIDMGKNPVRILTQDFIMEFVHNFKFSEDKFHSAVCLGGVKGGGFAPKDCPACAEAQRNYKEAKAIKDDPASKTDKKLKAEARVFTDEGNSIRAKKTTITVAVKGKIAKKGTKKTIVFENEAKFLKLTDAQWKKLTKDIFDDYDFMKSGKDISNRNLLFIKETKEGNKKNSTYTEVVIKPSENTSKAPEVEGGIPDPEEAFTHLDLKELKKLVAEYRKAQGDDIDDEDLEDDEDIEEVEEEDEDMDDEDDEEEDDEEDDEEEEEKPKNKSSKSKSKSKSSKKKKSSDFLDDDDDEDPEF